MRLDFEKHQSTVKRMTKSNVVLVFFWLLFSVGCQSTDVAVPMTGPNEDTHSESKVLNAGDVISVSIPAAPELSQSQKIRIDGKISLPMIGEVTAAGKSIKSFQSELSGLYQSELQNPEVVVNLVSGAAIVYVNGQVLVPGKILLDREMTALEAIMESGGFSELANLKKVTITRQEEGKYKKYLLNFKDSERPVFYVKAFDTITVERRLF